MNEDKKYELFVEGRNDQCIIASIGYQKGLKHDRKLYVLSLGDHEVSIKYEKENMSGSDDTAYELLKDALTIPQQYGAVAIVVDADDFNQKRAQDRLQKFINIVNKATAEEEVYDTNVSLRDDGIVLTPTKQHASIYPKIGLWVMPDNRNTGAIEYFLWQCGAEQKYNNTYSTVENTINHLEQKQDNPPVTHYISNHHHKALVHTFLAWVEEPGNPMGTSVDKKCWNINTKLVKDFIDWLTRVFG